MASAVIGALRVNLGLDTAQFQDGLKQSQKQLSGFGQTLRKAILPVAAAGAAALGGITLAVRGVLNEADAMAKASQKFGVPIEELSRLKHAADLSGVSFEGMGTALRRLSQNMNDAISGKGEGFEAFQQLSISVQDAEGNLKSTSQVLDEIAEKFAAMPDGAEKTALAMDLMGRSGADMIPMLNAGADGLKQMKDEADDLGIVIDEKTAKSAENFNDNLDRLGKMFTGLATTLTAQLAPHLANLTGWLVENGPQIQEVVRAMAEWIGKIVALAIEINGQVLGALRDLAVIVSDVGKAVIGAVQPFVDLADKALGAVSRMVSGIIEWLQGKLGPVFDWVGRKAKEVGDFFFEMYDRVVGNSYVPDMVAGIADEFAKLDGVMVAPAVAGTGEVTGAFAAMGETAQDAARQAREAAAASREAAAAAREAAAGGDGGPPADGLGLGFSGVRRQIEESTSALDEFGQLGDRIFDSLINGTFSWRDALSQVLDTLKQIISQQLGGSGGGGGGLFSSILGLVGSGLGAAGGFVGAGGFTTAGGFGAQSITAATSAATSAGAGIFSSPGVIALPGFARGGIARPGYAIVGEEGPELLKLDTAARVFSNRDTMEMLERGGGDTINLGGLHIHGVKDADSFRKSKGQLRAIAAKALQDASRSRN